MLTRPWLDKIIDRQCIKWHQIGGTVVGPMDEIYVQIRPKRISEEIVAQLKSLIFSGKLKPGEKLPPERDLAKLLGVSRVSLREALNALQGMGLVEIQQGNRSFVRPITTKSIHDPLVAFTKSSRENVIMIIEVRKYLEMGAASLAAERATGKEIKRLEKVLKDMEEDLQKNRLGAKADLDFHSIIVDATRNHAYIHVLHTVYDLLQEELRIAWAGVFRKRDRRQLLFEQHKRIFQAIKKRDSKRSADEVLAHLTFVEENWREALGGWEPTSISGP